MALPCDPGTEISVNELVQEVNNKVDIGDELPITGGVLTGPLFLGQDTNDVSITVPIIELNNPDNTTNLRWTQYETTTFVTGNVKINSSGEEVPLNDTYPYIFRYGLNMSGTTNRGFRVQYSDAVADTPTNYTTLFQVNDEGIYNYKRVYNSSDVTNYGYINIIRSDDSFYSIRFRALDGITNRSRIYRASNGGVGDLGIQNYDNNANSVGQLLLKADGSLIYNGTELAPAGEIITYFTSDRSKIPSGCLICDGTKGTPDLSNKFEIYSTGELIYLMRVQSIQEGPTDE